MIKDHDIDKNLESNLVDTTKFGKKIDEIKYDEESKLEKKFEHVSSDQIEKLNGSNII